MDFLYLIFYGCWRLRFLDVETNPGPRCPAPAVCRILCGNLWTLAGNLSDLTVASSQYDILLRLWSQICVTCRRCWFPVSVALSCCVGARCKGPVGWLHTFEMVTEHFANRNLSVVVAKCCFLWSVVWNRTFMCTVFIATMTSEPLSVQSLSQPWPRRPDFYCFLAAVLPADWECQCVFPVCGWFERPSSGVVGFYDHEPSWNCGLWLRNSLRLRSVGCRQNQCTWWNS